MTAKTDILAEAESAVTMRFENAEIAGAEVQDDGSVTLRLERGTPDKDASTQECDIAGAYAKAAGKTGGDEDTDTSPDTDCGDAEDGSEGGYEPSVWTVKGREMGFNELQKAVSESEMDYPSDPTGDKLAEMLQKAASGPQEQEQEPESEGDENDTQNGSNPATEWPKTEYLRNGNVNDEHIKTVQEKAEEGCIECGKPGCRYAANGENAKYCASHENDKKRDNNQSDTPADNRDLSDLSDVDKKMVNNLMENENKSLDEAIQMV